MHLRLWGVNNKNFKKGVKVLINLWIVLSGYFLYDSIDMYLNNRLKSNWEVTLHHIAVSWCFFLPYHYQVYDYVIILNAFVFFKSVYVYSMYTVLIKCEELISVQKQQPLQILKCCLYISDSCILCEIIIKV